jgi:hypothetical protein
VVSYPAGRVSRRRVLGAASTALLLAGCGRAADPTGQELRRLSPAARDGDVAILNTALGLEYQLIGAYAAGIPLLAGPAKAAAQRFLGQDLSHAGALAGLVKEAKAQPIKQKAGYELGNPRDASDVLRLLHALERSIVGYYLNVIPQLSGGHTRASLASILANNAQHLAVLRASLGASPVPSAFVTERE